MATSERVGPRLRPLSFGEILDVAVKTCLAHWRPLLKAVLVVVVPVQVLSAALTADYTLSSLETGSGSARTPQETIDELNRHLDSLAILSVLQVSAALLTVAACARVIAQAHLGEETDWRSSLALARRHAPSVLLLVLLYGLGVALGSLFFVLPGVWLAVAWALATPALLLEGLRSRAALGRSFRLVNGRWWRTFGVLVLGFVLARVISWLAQGAVLVWLFAGADSDAVVLLLATLAGVVGLAISTPFQAALLITVYFDLRVRKEGFDREQLAQEVRGERPRAAGAPAPPRDEEVERPGAPFWPPPPGWEPRRGEPDGGGGAGPDERPRLPGGPHG